MSAERDATIELRRLARDNAADLAILETVRDVVEDLVHRPVPLGAEAAAYLSVKLHAWYTGLEAIFERIARVVEGSLPSGPAWHQNLLRGMTLQLPDVRPGVIGPERLADLAELLSFRHFFRHAYAVDLDETRLRQHAERLVRLHPSVREDIVAFEGVIQGWIRTLETQSPTE